MDSINAWFDYMTESGQVGDRFMEHAWLVLQVMGTAGVLSVVLGIVAHRVKALRTPLLGIAGVFLTIPSLALFAIFIPIVGLGFRPSFIALVMYAILPILRNTITGLDEVDAAIVESAKGMGLNAWQRLARVELPMAWPVIITGARVSTLLTTGIAAIATLVNGPGLGYFIKDGLRNYPQSPSVEAIWTGTVLTVVLALILDAAFTIIRRFTTSPGLRH